MVAAASRDTGSKASSGNILTTSGDVQWDKKMSNNCAFALLTYTLLQIFVVMGSLETKGMSVAPYFGLLLLVAIIIPVCRKYEQRWQTMAKSGLTHQSITAKYRKDQIVLWVLALGLPFLFVAIFKAAATMF
jgi:hypothetical protein